MLTSHRDAAIIHSTSSSGGILPILILFFLLKNWRKRIHSLFFTTSLYAISSVNRLYAISSVANITFTVQYLTLLEIKRLLSLTSFKAFYISSSGAVYIFLVTIFIVRCTIIFFLLSNSSSSGGNMTTVAATLYSFDIFLNFCGSHVPLRFSASPLSITTSV